MTDQTQVVDSDEVQSAVAELALEDGEVEIVASDDLLLRHVHPKFVDDGVPTRNVFAPFSNDAGKLSTQQRSRIAPEDAYAEWTARLAAVGTWGVTVAETEVRVIDDSANVDWPSHHASVDFRAFSRRETERRSKLIRAKALERGCLHPE